MKIIQLSYRCDICPYSTDYKSNLTRHMRIHKKILNNDNQNHYLIII